MIQDPQLKKFFDFAIERYQIYINKQLGFKRPWTKDPVLQKYYFCNIFREDDKTTIWIKENLREPLRNSHYVIFVMAFSRYINKIESLARVKNVLLEPERKTIFLDLKRQLEHVEPLCGGAYMIRSTNGYQKLDGILHQLVPVYDATQELVRSCKTLESLHRTLCAFNYVGGFMAYEVVTDVRHTNLLQYAKDINTWAHPGPGAARGLVHLTGYHEELTKQKRLNLMRVILEESKTRWPSQWPKWEMREVEHTLCEYDKYVRGCNGGRLKRRYR